MYSVISISFCIVLILECILFLNYVINDILRTGPLCISQADDRTSHNIINKINFIITKIDSTQQSVNDIGYLITI